MTRRSAALAALTLTIFSAALAAQGAAPHAKYGAWGVADADQIVVLNEGRVAERGTHAQLLRRNGLYADMWARQQAEAEAEEAEAAE